jgi:hypothetical protein
MTTIKSSIKLTLGSVSLGVGGFGASGGPFGSTVSLRSARSDDGKRSSSVSSGQDTWNKHTVVPEIRGQCYKTFCP